MMDAEMMDEIRKLRSEIRALTVPETDEQRHRRELRETLRQRPSYADRMRQLAAWREELAAAEAQLPALETAVREAEAAYLAALPAARAAGQEARTRYRAAMEALSEAERYPSDIKVHQVSRDDIRQSLGLPSDAAIGFWLGDDTRRELDWYAMRQQVTPKWSEAMRRRDEKVASARAALQKTPHVWPDEDDREIRCPLETAKQRVADQRAKIRKLKASLNVQVITEGQWNAAVAAVEKMLDEEAFVVAARATWPLTHIAAADVVSPPRPDRFTAANSFSGGLAWEYKEDDRG